MSESRRLSERLTIQTDRPPAISLAALTWASGRASAVTVTPHGFTTGDFATVAGALPIGYTGKVQVTVTSPTTFTYAATGPLTTPATGALTVTYAADTHGGRAGLAWRVLATIYAEFIPLRTYERLDRGAVESGLACRFRVRARADLRAGMRAIWLAVWPPGATTRTLLVKGVEPDGTDREYLLLQCEEVARLMPGRTIASGRKSRAAALELTATLPGLATTSTRLTGLKVAIADWTPFWHFYFSPLFYQHEAEIFASGRGGHWKPLSARYAKWKVRHFPGRGLLVATGALKTSLTRPFAAGSIFRASAQGLVIGSSVPYALAHFTGTGPQSRGPKSLPKRRAIYVPWQFLHATAPGLKKWIRDQAAKEQIPGLEDVDVSRH